MQPCTYSHAHTESASDQGCNVSASSSESGINLSALFLVVTCSVQSLIILTVKGQLFRLWAGWMEHCYTVDVHTIHLCLSWQIQVHSLTAHSTPLSGPSQMKCKNPRNRIHICYYVKHTKNWCFSRTTLRFKLCGHHALKIIFWVYSVLFTAEMYNCVKRQLSEELHNAPPHTLKIYCKCLDFDFSRELYGGPVSWTLCSWRKQVQIDNSKSKNGGITVATSSVESCEIVSQSVCVYADL